jgi:hypothetical protein
MTAEALAVVKGVVDDVSLGLPIADARDSVAM